MIRWHNCYFAITKACTKPPERFGRGGTTNRASHVMRSGSYGECKKISGLGGFGLSTPSLIVLRSPLSILPTPTLSPLVSPAPLTAAPPEGGRCVRLAAPEVSRSLS